MMTMILLIHIIRSFLYIEESFIDSKLLKAKISKELVNIMHHKYKSK